MEIKNADEQATQTILNILRNEKIVNIQNKLKEYCIIGKKDFNELLKEYTSILILNTTLEIIKIIESPVELPIELSVDQIS